jgi:hypothetical protein
MSNRWPGGIINATAPVPTGGGAGDSAPGVWTIDQADQYIAVQEWPGTGIPDPQFQYVTALLHGDGVNGGQNNTFLDSSSNNFSITRNGNTTQGSFSPYGNLWSNFFTTNNYLTAPANAAFQMGSGDFTIEAWIFPTATAGSSNSEVISYGAPNEFDGWHFYQVASTNVLSFGLNYAGLIVSSSAALPLNTWTHVAVTRSGTTFKLWINGVNDGTATSSTSQSTNANDKLYVGTGSYSQGADRSFIGYISNARVIKGSAIYSATFTPSTTPLTAISGTSVLTCQSNRFIDNSSNAFAITVTGSPSVQRFSPFQNLATYQPAVIGGSGYFDGTGDFLTVANNAALNVETGDFCVECWFNRPSYASGTDSDILVAKGTNNFVLAINPSNQIQFAQYGVALLLTSTTIVTYNQWFHVAVTRSGTTLRMFVNGVQEASTTSSANFTSTTALNIGLDPLNTAQKFIGYISNLRLVKGSAVYTSAFTPSTAPLTAVSGTSLLTNFTNGAIFDSDASNNFETVGNAQISTSVVKYGTGSMAFDGSGDGLNAPDSPQFDMGSGNFTVEMWLYANSLSGEQFLVGQHNNSTYYAPFRFAFDGSRLVAFMSTTGSSWGLRLEAGSSLSTSTWYHIALVRNGTSFKIYVNGNQYDSGTLNGALYNSTDIMRVGWGSISAGVFSLNGYIDDLRITKGYARYWYNFQPPTRAFPNYGGTVVQPVEDPLFQYNTLLLNGNGTNGAQNNTFLDSSTNNFTITRNGNTTQGSFSPYGTLWSNFFNGSNAYLTAPNDTNWQIGSTSTYSVEAWVNVGSTSAQSALCGALNRWWLGSNFTDVSGASGKFCFAVFNGSSWQTISSATTVVAGTWYHVAATFNNGTTRLYINGVQEATTTGVATNTATGTLFVGAILNPGYSYGLTGYLSNIRITKGSALPYTANFTPSTTPLTAVSGTVFLSCQSNRFVDNSTNNYTITASGTPSVQRFSPFKPTAPYSTSVIGGSGYFDGTGDSLSVANNTALEFGSGDFTIETFVYFNSLATNRGIVYLGTDPNSNFSYGLQWSGNVLYFWYTTNGSDLTNKNASWTPVTSTWYHVAVTRSGNDLRFFVDGAQIGTTQSLSGVTIFDSTSAMLIGGEATGSPTSLPGPMNGYISNLRILKGTALYTSNFTVPTAPLTAITNTSLLTSMTNAGIPDLAMMNNWETVGNAQVSTAQSKFGGSSLAFDGTTDGLVLASNPPQVLRGDFTIESWVYLNNTTGFQTIIGRWQPSNQEYLLWVSSGTVQFYLRAFSDSTPLVSSSSTLSATTWTHVAVIRNGSTFTIYINGTSAGTATNSSAMTVTNAATTVGSILPGFSGYDLNGFIQDLRITNGIARYVQPFTPPTQAFQTY